MKMDKNYLKSRVGHRQSLGFLSVYRVRIFPYLKMGKLIVFEVIT